MDKKKKMLIIKFIMIASVIGIITSIANIGIWYYENKRNTEIKKELEKSIITEIPTEKPIEEDIEEEYVDFESLKKINSETIAYLKVNGTSIDYVVVKGNDNSYYLKHNFNHEYNRSGWIFMDYRNNFDGTDKNVIIYGHNTLDGSMFGTLRRIITDEWYSNNDNHFITLVTEKGINYYQVFSTYSIKVEDYYITTDFASEEEYLQFVNNLKSRSVYDYGVSVNEMDSILTLSTCTGNGSKRMVLHAKLISN